MKTKRFSRKLTLNKHTVSHLRVSDLKGLKGGAFTRVSCYYTCEPCDTEWQTCHTCPDLETEYDTCYTGWCC
jgi:natural product precursor